MTTANLDVAHVGTVCIGALRGEVDFSNARDLGNEVLSQMTNEATGLVLDLQDVRYLDSSGVALVFRLSRALSNRRQAFAIALPATSPLRRLFAVTAIEGVVSVAETVEGAVKALASPGGDAA
jgi:anti-anti-sigma factor